MVLEDNKRARAACVIPKQSTVSADESPQADVALFNQSWCLTVDADAADVVHDEPFAHDVRRRVPATEKAKRVLGFEAATSLDQMLDEVIPWIARAVETGTI